MRTSSSLQEEIRRVCLGIEKVERDREDTTAVCKNCVIYAYCPSSTEVDLMAQEILSSYIFLSTL